MRETFKVTKVDSKEIEMIKVDDGKYEGDCSKCALAHVCHGAGKDRVLKLEKEMIEANLKKDDLVEIELPEWFLTKLTFFVYLIPLIIFLTAALLSYHFLKDEKLSFYISISSLILSAVILRMTNKLALKKFINSSRIEKRK